MANTWWLEHGQLDDEQKGALALPKEGSYLITGPPGSGKTNLVLLRASYLARSGQPDVAIVMFTRTLRNFVMRGSNHYTFAPEKVRTFFSWEQSLLREHGRAVDSDNMSFPEFRRALARSLAELFDEKPALKHHLDCVLVDEVQDCWPEEVDLFFAAAKHVFLAGDSRQEIYEARGTLDLLKPPRVLHHPLKNHYRNGHEICKVADVLAAAAGESPLGLSRYPEEKEKSSVEFLKCDDDATQLQALVSRLEVQLKAFPENDELLGVVCAKNDDVSSVRTGLLQSAVGSAVLPGDDLFNVAAPQERIFVCTMHDAKGLEFRALHVPFMERVTPVGRSSQKRLAFTTVTRAQTSLTIYHVAGLPGYLEKSRDTLRHPEEIEPGDVFPKATGK